MTPLRPDARCPQVAAVSAVALGAVLLFGMEPLVGQLVLPQLGGAAAVWSTCLMVFQVTLLAAYVYAHLLAPRIGAAHLAVAAVPLLVLPLSVVVGAGEPLPALLLALLASVVPPFFALATTAVVVQSWMTRSDRGSEPYVLYAVSNAGALAILLAYPLLVQPLLGHRMQQLAWSVTYVGWLVALGATWWLLRPVVAGVPRPVAPVPVRVQLHWLLLAAGPSALLLAVTHVLTIDTGPIPMLWVLPLALYLTSFVVAFSGRWPHEELAQWWPEWVAVALLLYLAAPFSLAWPAMLASFTALCLLAHGTLHHLRPEPGQLTHFYLVLAAGGAVGGVLVSLAAPLWFSRLTEYPIAVAVTGLALALSVGAPWTVWRRMLFVPGSRPALLLMLMLAFPVGWFALEPEGVLEESRSFYGLLRVDIVVDEDGERVRRLVSGHTVHGGVYVDRVAEPLHYYARGGPLHFAVEQRQTGPTHLGMIGLGTGAMAYWADADDRVSFYEIDAEGVRLAERWFPFLAQSDAEVSVQVGDGRLLVDADPNVDAQPLDVLLVDAFAGDAVPTHLLTVEAIRTYMAHMEHGGLVVFHISSNILDLSGVLDAVATELGLAIAFFPGEGWHPPRASYARSDVVVLAADTDRLAPFAEAGWLRTWEHPAAAVWTDDYIHPWQPLIARWLRGSK